MRTVFDSFLNLRHIHIHTHSSQWMAEASFEIRNMGLYPEDCFDPCISGVQVGHTILQYP